ncbi:NACHT domain-containing protein, partial [Actinosynnema sp. NPDC059797]
AQVNAAHELPYRLPGQRRPSLAAVHVRQDLSTGTEEPRPEPPPTPILDGHGHLVEAPRPPVARVAVRPPARAVREALDGDDHLVITGGAGQGKSTLSLRLAADVAGRWCGRCEDDPLAEPVVPLRLTARELAKRLDLPFTRALADSARAEYGALLSTPVGADLLTDRVAGCRWLLLVDALDEVADGADRDRLVRVLSALAEEPAYRVVVTTRPIEGAALAPLQRVGAARYELQPFDDRALRRFAENWFAEDGPDLADRFVRQVREAHLGELVRVPLLATIAAIIFGQRHDHPLPDNQYELYEAYLAFLRAARTSTGRFEDHRTPLLEHLGRVRLETDTSLVVAAREWVHRHVPPPERGSDWADELTSFLVSVGPLVVRGDDLRFLHHSFAEHLAATARARELPEHFDPAHEDFTRLLHAARPEERGRYARAVVLHYARLRPAEADPLVEALHAGDAEQHLLAARLLAKRVPAGEEVVDAFLGTVRAWAMTRQHPGGDILSQTCRAAHHPGLAGWLVELMRAGTAPWRSRTEAAAALASRVRCDHSAEAIAFLTDLVDDPGTAVGDRLAAAEALADCGEAERGPAERGLRAVLANPLASGYDCRTAGVLLAAFDGAARQCAVEVLSRLVGSEETPTQDLVEAATGLIEIGVEFHSVAASVFRAVLEDPVKDMAGRRDAALGLASLGPEGTAEAAELLTALIADHRHGSYDRADAASVLGELGPQHRVAAADRLLAMLAEPDLTRYDRSRCAAQLLSLDPRRREVAIGHLRSVMTDSRSTPSEVRWSAKHLSDLGPEFFAEAAEVLRRLYSDAPLSATWRVVLLGSLLQLGEPYRAEAIELLREQAGDHAAAPADRWDAAERLMGAGPEFIAEVMRCFREIATSLDHDVALRAWQEVLRSGTEHHDEALTALLDVIGESPAWVFVAAKDLVSSDEDTGRVADALLRVLKDPTRSFQSKASAVYSLAGFSGCFHRAAVTELRALIGSVTLPRFDFPYFVESVARMGVGLRRDVARALRDLLHDPDATSVRLWRVCAALDQLGFAGAEVVTALRTVVADPACPSYARCGAAVTLAEIAPEHTAEAAEAVLHQEEDPDTNSWRNAVLALIRLGVDVEPRLRALAAGPSRLIDPGAVMKDEHASIAVRSEAAVELALTDRSATRLALPLLRWFVRDPRATPSERAAAAYWLVSMGRFGLDVDAEVLAEVARHPATDPTTRRRLIGQLPRDIRTEVERILLADHALPIDQRIPHPDMWDDSPLAAEAEAAVRDVLAAPETPWRERIAAASALADLSLRLVPEAADVLRRMWDERPDCAAVGKALARLGPKYRAEALARGCTGHPVEFASDDPTEIRATRDDERATPASRWRAAVKLVRSTEDRAAATRLLDALAADPATRPALRWRAARDLADLDRRRSEELLLAMATDTTLPVTTRANAAEALNETAPARRALVVKTLRALLPTAKPLERVKILATLGTVTPSTAALELLRTARDARSAPVVRVRCAEAAADLGREFRESASVAVRAVARDESVPRHVRRRAARDLARWSELCREEARRTWVSACSPTR